MLLLTAMLGCKSDQELTTTTVDNSEDTVPDGTLVLDTPESVAWAAEGPMTISGQVENINSLTLNGADIAYADGRFSETITLSRGINHIALEAIDVGNDPLSAKATVLAGEFASPGDEALEDVLSAHLSHSGLDAVGDVAAAALDPSLLLDKEGSINPIYSSNPIVGTWLDADLVGLTFSPADIAITPTGGALELQAVLPDLVVDVLAYGEVAWIDYDIDFQMTATQAVITAEVMIEAVDGELEIVMLDPEIELQGFTYDLSLLPSFIEDYFFVETIQGTVEDMLVEQVNEMVPTMIDETLSGLEFSYTLELFETPLTVGASFQDVDITSEGMGIDLDVTVEVPGSGDVSYAGYLVAPTSVKPAHDMDAPLSLVMADDLLNRVLFELWRGGAMSLTLSTEDGSLDPSTLEGLPLETATINVRPQLPPVVVSAGTGMQLQGGAVDIDIYTPGASFGEYIYLRLTATADAAVAIEEGTVTPQIGEVFLDIEVLDSGLSLPDSSISELVDWALPQDQITTIASDLGIALPSLGGITISSAEMSREKDDFHTGVSIEFGVE